MKNRIFQLYLYFNNIDRRYVQLAYSMFMFVIFVMQGSPDDGGGGTR